MSALLIFPANPSFGEGWLRKMTSIVIKNREQPHFAGKAPCRKQEVSSDQPVSKTKTAIIIAEERIILREEGGKGLYEEERRIFFRRILSGSSF